MSFWCITKGTSRNATGMRRNSTPAGSFFCHASIAGSNASQCEQPYAKNSNTSTCLGSRVACRGEIVTKCVPSTGRSWAVANIGLVASVATVTLEN
jgi:hypothetical protein